VVGADGLLVEVHPEPDKALTDGVQSLTFGEFQSLMHDLQLYIELAAELRQWTALVAEGVS
jgi:3-deoxy-7-phosphoheptulonate synthase